MVLRFVIAALATWRVTFMLIRENGPLNIFTWWRTLLDKAPGVKPLAHCAKCLSVWVGLLAAVAMVTDCWIILIPFALSAVVIGLENYVYR